MTRSGLARHDAEARYDGVGGHDGSIEDAHVVLDDGKLPNDDARTDVHMAPDARGLDDGGGPDIDMVSDSKGHVGEGTTT